MSLVDREHSYAEAVPELEYRGGFVGCDRNSALAQPALHRGVFAAAVHPHNSEVAVLFDFAAPVCQHGGRTNDREMSCSAVAQVYHGGDCLNGFAQTHLVAEQDPALCDRVFYAPFLIAAQRAAKPRKVELNCGDRLRELLGQTVNIISRAYFVGLDRL